MEKVFLEISQNLQENNCARVSFLIKLDAKAKRKRKKKKIDYVTLRVGVSRSMSRF